ncbi:MAG: oligosaccharide repeat unit polymerase [Acholeplasmatales bacterium]|nr:oligosaccharide repeat unit polymerase [Acholeplasmatales bacterium]
MGFFVFLYSITGIGMIVSNYKLNRRILSSINIYLIIWVLMVLLFGARWINYYYISEKTMLFIYISTVLVFLGYRLGSKIKLSNKPKPPKTKKSFFKNKRKLKNEILIISFISMLAIIPNTIFLMQRYGFNLLSKTTQIYYDNVAGTAPFSIPYIGALAQVACILAGIYFALYGFKKFLLLPLVLAMVGILPSGSRGWLILTILFVLFPTFITKRFGIKTKLSKGKIVFIIGILLTFVLFLILTINRSKYLDPNIYKYMSPGMIKVANSAPWLFKLYQYFASPIGVYNAYLAEPNYYFGKNTFAVLYNFLNKMGVDVVYDRYQKFYSIPIETNVGTWLLELTQDFTYIGLMYVVFLFSIFVGYFERKAVIYKKAEDLMISSLLNTVLVMSFFVWYFREGTMIVVLLVCLLIKVFSKIRIPIRI